MTPSNPLVSFIIITYNQAQFVLDSISAALAQTYEPLEIVISDDCSTDDTFNLIKGAAADYHGPHQLVLHRNQSNLGLVGNLNRAFGLAHGEFFVVAGGDDISLPTRTATLVRRWRDPAAPADLVFSKYIEMDVRGTDTGSIGGAVILPDLTRDVFRWECVATGASASYSRKLIDKYGLLDSDLCAEDHVLPFRAWLESGIACIDEPLVRYRRHDQSVSTIFGATGTEPSRRARRSRRLRIALARLATARDWFRAWEIAGRDRHGRTHRRLRAQIRARNLEVQAFSARRTRALLLAVQHLLSGGGIAGTARLVVRHVLRWD